MTMKTSKLGMYQPRARRNGRDTDANNYDQRYQPRWRYILMNVVYFLDSHCTHFGNPWRNCSSGACYRRIYLQSQSSIYALQVRRRNATFKASQWGLIRRDVQEKNSGVINPKAILRFIAYEHLFRTPPPLIERKSKKSIIIISHYSSVRQPGCRNEKIFLGDCHVPIFHPSNESNPYEVHLHTTRNEMTRVRDREIKIVNFTPRTDSVNLVVVAVDCNVGHCLPIAYSRLCQHKKTLTVQEGGRLGIETVCLLYRARQKVREIRRCKSMTLQSHSSENWSTRPSMGCSSRGRRCPSWSPDGFGIYRDEWEGNLENSGRDRFESRTCLDWGETRLGQYRR